MAITHTVRVRSRCILVVTNQPLAALRMRAGLKALPNCNVSFVFDREEATYLVWQEPPDLLILDYCATGVNGLNLAKVFKRLYPETVIIMLTAKGNNRFQQREAELYAGRVLEKPVGPAELYRVALAALTTMT
jgi:DNA-binding response OmpR family regulator